MIGRGGESMRTTGPVIVYETKPATEWLLGGPVQKVSPRFAHSVMQRELGTRVGAWARGRGRVGPEWRFWITPPGEESRYLVPDVGYLSYERLGRDAGEAAEEPQLAPDVAFEVLSPSDRHVHVEHKIDVYLRGGTSLVVVIDPTLRTLRAVDRTGERSFGDTGVFEHAALPGFALDLADFFAELED
jgi:Uma2 family endonuclease